jgi:diguanylate cyclase (GGDEF)-like protein
MAQVRVPVYDFEPQAAFWRRHVRIGVALHTLGALAVLAYAIGLPRSDDRTALLILDIVSLVVSATVTRSVGIRLVTTDKRESFFFFWSASTLAFIAAAAALDGGTHSPLAFLLVLPMLFAGLAYTPGVVAGVAIFAVACAGGVASATNGPRDAMTLTFVLATGIAGALTIGGASNRSKLHGQLLQLATIDSLTSCLSRSAFQRRLLEEVERARRYDRSFALVMVDVDNLKLLNDTSGHGAGDEALQQVSTALMKAARASDVVGRLGGDEFAVLLPETRQADIPAVLDRLSSALHSDEVDVPTTVSVGSTVWCGPSDSHTEMLLRADEALYAAKSAGRNRSVTWESSIFNLGDQSSRALLP